MDLRDAQRRESGVGGVAGGSASSLGGVCERCGKGLGGSGFMFNGKKLCSSCIQAEKDKTDYYGGGPAPITPAIKVEEQTKSKKKSILEYIVANVIGALAVEKRKEKEKLKDMKPEIKYARPMNEDGLEKQGERPETAFGTAEKPKEREKSGKSENSEKSEQTEKIPLQEPEKTSEEPAAAQKEKPRVQAISVKAPEKPKVQSEGIIVAMPLEEDSLDQEKGVKDKKKFAVARKSDAGSGAKAGGNSPKAAGKIAKKEAGSAKPAKSEKGQKK